MLYSDWCCNLQIEKAIITNELAFESSTWSEVSSGAKDFISK